MVDKEKKQTLESFFQTAKIDIEKKIKDLIEDEEIISTMRGGKRLRPLVSHLSYKVCTKGKETTDEYNHALEGTVSLELAHNASLIHDDIMDKDTKRRQKTALHIEKGTSYAILTGHKMLSKGFEIALNQGEKIARLFIDTWKEVVEGQLNEININRENKDNLLESFNTKSKLYDMYKQIIDQKTAALFASSCKAGAIEAKTDGKIPEILYDYGLEVGRAYQLADDLVDLENGEMIGSVVIPLLSRVENGKIDKDSLNFSTMNEKIEKNKDKIRKMYLKEIKKHVRKAEKLSKSKVISSSKYKEFLTEAPFFIVNKMLSKVDISI
ncbi:MAG: polyprenyl synthetase family protein [Candidatus Thermoplasmatota archaeon]